jgi:hypothetical protein
MELITVALLAFIFYCIFRPTLICNRTQYYAAFGLTLGVIFVDRSLNMFGISAVAYGISGLLQVAAIIVLFFAVGGDRAGEFGSELDGAFETIAKTTDPKKGADSTSSATD